MAISSYEKDGKTLWRVYVNVRSKVYPSIRKQKAVENLASEKVANAEEKKWLQILTEEVIRLESKGVQGGNPKQPWIVITLFSVIENKTPGTLLIITWQVSDQRGAL